MYNFDLDAYYTDAKLTYETRAEIERVADEVTKEGFKNIFFISSGGSLAVMRPIQYLLRSKTKIPTYCEIASEVILTGNSQLNEDSIVITSSKSGTTKETVEAIQYCNERNIRVIAFCGKPDTPVDQLATYSIIGKAKDAVEFEYIQHYLLAFRLLYNNGEFDAYERLAAQLEKLPEDLIAIKEQFEPTAAAIAEKYHNSNIQYWIGGADFKTPHVDDQFKEIIATSIVTTILDERLAIHYERVTGHDLTIRRYYRQFEY